jgi:hypothetical protein
LCGAFADGHLHKLYRGCEAPFFLSVISENATLMGAVDDRCGILLEMNKLKVVFLYIGRSRSKN